MTREGTRSTHSALTGIVNVASDEVTFKLRISFMVNMAEGDVEMIMKFKGKFRGFLGSVCLIFAVEDMKNGSCWDEIKD